MIEKLQCDRRVLLSGTPMQNDLEEFFTISNLCMRNSEDKEQGVKRIFGTLQNFRQKVQMPLLRGREPGRMPKGCEAPRRGGE